MLMIVNGKIAYSDLEVIDDVNIGDDLTVGDDATFMNIAVGDSAAVDQQVTGKIMAYDWNGASDGYGFYVGAQTNSGAGAGYGLYVASGSKTYDFYNAGTSYFGGAVSIASLLVPGDSAFGPSAALATNTIIKIMAEDHNSASAGYGLYVDAQTNAGAGAGYGLYINSGSKTYGFYNAGTSYFANALQIERVETGALSGDFKLIGWTLDSSSASGTPSVYITSGSVSIADAGVVYGEMLEGSISGTVTNDVYWHYKYYDASGATISGGEQYGFFLYLAGNAGATDYAFYIDGSPDYGLYVAAGTTGIYNATTLVNVGDSAMGPSAAVGTNTILKIMAEDHNSASAGYGIYVDAQTNSSSGAGYGLYVASGSKTYDLYNAGTTHFVGAVTADVVGGGTSVYIGNTGLDSTQSAKLLELEYVNDPTSASSGDVWGIYGVLNVGGAQNNTSLDLKGADILAQTGDTVGIRTLTGLYVRSIANGYSVSGAGGLVGAQINASGNATMSSITGIDLSCVPDGDVTNDVIGLKLTVGGSSGTLSGDVYGIQVTSSVNQAGGGQNYGIYVSVPNVATDYGIYVTCAGDYGLYVAAGTTGIYNATTLVNVGDSAMGPSAAVGTNTILKIMDEDHNSASAGYGLYVAAQINSGAGSAYAVYTAGGAVYFAGGDDFTWGVEPASGVGGGVEHKVSTATVEVAAAASITCNVNVPSGCILLGCSIRVDSALAAGDTWDAEWNDGASLQSICTNQAVSVNTKVYKLHDPNADTPLTDAETDIVITKNGGGAFTAQGEIRCVAYYLDLNALSDYSLP